MICKYLDIVLDFYYVPFSSKCWFLATKILKTFLLITSQSWLSFVFIRFKLSFYIWSVRPPPDTELWQPKFYESLQSREIIAMLWIRVQRIELNSSYELGRIVSINAIYVTRKHFHSHAGKLIKNVRKSKSNSKT